VDEKEVLALAGQHLSQLKKAAKSPSKPLLFKEKQKKPQVKLHPKKKEQAHFILGFMGEGRNYKRKLVQAVLAAILGGGMSSRLFSEVRERRGLAYSVRTSVERYEDTGYIGTYAGVDVARIDEAIAVTLNEHYKLASGETPISAKELKKAKEFIKGHLALSLEDTKDVNYFFADQELYLPKIETPEDIFKGIDRVSLEEVIAEAKKAFKPEKLNLAIIGPYGHPERFQRLLK
ncbi:insulinase family protein, partial [Candidatus Woesebacteria bacterium]|nr:insulinase family protein [Candidatus Woesebacteria bacterium]